MRSTPPPPATPAGRRASSCGGGLGLGGLEAGERDAGNPGAFGMINQHMPVLGRHPVASPHADRRRMGAGDLSHSLPPAKGQTYRLTAGAFFEVKNGKVARISNFYNLQDWLKQVGAA